MIPRSPFDGFQLAEPESWNSNNNHNNNNHNNHNVNHNNHNHNNSHNNHNNNKITKDLEIKSKGSRKALPLQCSTFSFQLWQRVWHRQYDIAQAYDIANQCIDIHTGQHFLNFSEIVFLVQSCFLHRWFRDSPYAKVGFGSASWRPITKLGWVGWSESGYFVVSGVWILVTVFLRSVILFSKVFNSVSRSSLKVVVSWAAWINLSWQFSSLHLLHINEAFFPKAGTPLTAASLRPVQSSFRCIRQPQQTQSKELSFFRIFLQQVLQESETNLIRFQVLYLHIFKGAQSQRLDEHTCWFFEFNVLGLGLRLAYLFKIFVA